MNAEPLIAYILSVQRFHILPVFCRKWHEHDIVALKYAFFYGISQFR